MHHPPSELDTLQMAPRKVVAIFFLVALSVLISGCEKIENQVVRWSGGTGSTHPITVVSLLAVGHKYDGLNVGVGGYLGPYYFGPAPSLYFVPEHIVAEDSTLGVWLAGEDSFVDFGRICENIGSYVRVFGKYDHENRKIDVEKVILINEPNNRLPTETCESLIE